MLIINKKSSFICEKCQGENRYLGKAKCTNQLFFLFLWFYMPMYPSVKVKLKTQIL